MATGALDANGIWQYGEDDSNTTFSALLNRLGSSTSTQIGSIKQAGRILQVVQGSTSTEVSTTSSTYINTGLTATITPRFSTSKILVLVTHPMIFKNAGNGDASVNIQLFRNSTMIQHFNNLNLWTGSSVQITGSTATNYLDSPATTSAVTYKTMFANYANATGISIQFRSMPSTITLIEVAG